MRNGDAVNEMDVATISSTVSERVGKMEEDEGGDPAKYRSSFGF